MKILFMGTPDIAATVLNRLITDGHSICAAVTGEDKPRGRGKVMTPTPVKALAAENGIPVYTPKTLKDEAFAQILEEVSPELIVVVAYGKILPESVLNFPRYGCVNLHVSLLPKYRGAAPMQRAIINGERETGVSIMYMDVGLDTGDIIASESFPIGKNDNFEDIHDRSADIGSVLLSRTITEIEKGTATRTPQDGSLATYAEKIEKADCKINFEGAAEALDCQIRGVTPIPGAFCYHNGRMLKIYKASKTDGKGKPGEVIEINGVGEGSFTVACGTDALKVLGVIPEGKGRMTAGDLIRGRKIALGDVLE